MATPIVRARRILTLKLLFMKLNIRYAPSWEVGRTFALKFRNRALKGTNLRESAGMSRKSSVFKCVFSCSANGADPVVREVFKTYARLNSTVLVSDLRIVYPTAHRTCVSLHEINLLLRFINLRDSVQQTEALPQPLPPHLLSVLRSCF